MAESVNVSTEIKSEEKKPGFGAFMKRVLPIAGRVAFILAIMFLVVYMVTVLTSSDDFFTDSAERTALVKFNDELDRANALAQVHFDNLYELVEKLEYANSETEVKDIVASYIGVSQFGDLRYYSQGKAYSAAGALIAEETSGDDVLSELSGSREPAVSRVYFDSTMKRDCIAFFVPVRGSEYVDGITSIIEARDVINTRNVIGDYASVSLLINTNGDVLSSATRSSFAESVGTSFYSFIGKLTYDNLEQKSVADAVRSGKLEVRSITSRDTEYVIVIQPLEGFSGNLSLISMSVSGGLVAPEMTYIRHIINLIVIAIISLIVGFIYAIFYYRESQKAIISANYTDATIGCPNAEQFRIGVAAALGEKQHRYALAVLEMRQFRYISENFPEDDVTEMLKYIAKVFETFCGTREAYGYLGDGRFATLITYNSERSISDRLRLIEAVVNKHAVLGENKAKKFDVGVCLAFEMRRHSATEIIGHATAACETARADINKRYVLYTEQVSRERDHNDRIEAEMEMALENGEFRLFLQPKYNVAQDRIDSAEALVRWFDPRTGDYRFPGEFISLFESNGFITKLDHFMYLETLKCLSASAERGDRVVPISVNVSLVTASAPDFLDFYIDNKKKYQIGDGFITIEFTESFAVGDQEKIREIVNRLHVNGIRSSLDDFGTGYASFNVLKQIPVDELKLDRIFLSRGISAENDDVLLETVIKLAKSLGIRVVQEGVETKEMFDSVVAKGCDVIQGYYYAKAIPAEEYRLFIGSNTSIKYKSLVK